MYAIEFETKIKDKFIEFPDYKKFQSQNVKVIILSKNPEKKIVQQTNKPKNLKFLFDNPIVIDSYKPLNRDEIHER